MGEFKWNSPTYYGNRKDRKVERLYSMWLSMRSRVNRNKSYTNISIDEKFNDYDYFYRWCIGQKGCFSKDSNGKWFELDKDIIGQDIYSPETCVFIPRELNSLIRSSDSADNMPRGVQYFEHKKNPYRAYSSMNGKQINYGYFSTKEEAYLVANKYRIKYIIDLANQYKDELSDIAYEKLINMV